MIKLKKLNTFISKFRKKQIKMLSVFYTPQNIPNLLFCFKINGIWKLHIYDGTKIYRINTGKADNIVQLSPTIYFDKSISKYILSWQFIQENNYILNKTVIQNFQDLYNGVQLKNTIQCFAYNGIYMEMYNILQPFLEITKDTVYTSLIYKHNEQVLGKLILKFYKLKNIVPVYGNCNQFLINVSYPNTRIKNCKVYLIDIKQYKIYQLKLKNNISFYNGCIDSYTGYYYYINPYNNNEVFVTSDWQLIPVTENIFTFEK